METFIELDDQKMIVNRAEYSFFVWLAMLGGITKIIRKYCGLLTDAISRKMFVNSILSDIFFVKDRKEFDIEGKERMALSIDELKKVNENLLAQGRTLTIEQDRLKNIATGDGNKLLRLVTTQEDKHYQQLKVRLAENTFKKDDANNLITHMFKNRTKY